MTKLNDMINNIETELIKILRDQGVKDINTGDIYKSAPQLPAVNLMLIDADMNEDDQVMQKNKIGWFLSYDVTCMFAGTERVHTFQNARTFVNKIYDVIQAEKDGKLNRTIFDLDCVRIEYGTTALADAILDGGVIKLIISIHEVR